MKNAGPSEGGDQEADEGDDDVPADLGPAPPFFEAAVEEDRGQDGEAEGQEGPAESRLPDPATAPALEVVAGPAALDGDVESGDRELGVRGGRPLRGWRSRGRPGAAWALR